MLLLFSKVIDKSTLDSGKYKQFLYEALIAFGLHSLLNKWTDSKDSTLTYYLNQLKERVDSWKVIVENDSAKSANQQLSSDAERKLNKLIKDSAWWYINGGDPFRGLPF